MLSSFDAYICFLKSSTITVAYLRTIFFFSSSVPSINARYLSTTSRINSASSELNSGILSNKETASIFSGFSTTSASASSTCNNLPFTASYLSILDAATSKSIMFRLTEKGLNVIVEL